MEKSKEKGALTIRQVAEMEGVSRRTIERRLKRGNIVFGRYEAYRIGETENAHWRLKEITQQPVLQAA